MGRIVFVITLLLACNVQAARASEPDLALQVPLVLTKASEAYAPGVRTWQGIPGIERSPNGRLWAVWYTGGKTEGPGNFLVVVTSSDEGKSWTKQTLVIAPPGGTESFLREYDPCLWLDPHGRLWLFWAQGVATWDGRGGVWAISTSNPDAAVPTWSKPRRMSNGVMQNKPIVSFTGRWLLPIAGRKNLPIVIRPPVVEASHQSWESLIHLSGVLGGSTVFESTDGLKTMHLLGEAHVPNTWADEHMIVQRKNRSFWMLVRTTNGIAQAISQNGREWTASGDAGLSPVNSRFFLRRLRSGNLLLVSNLPPTGTARSHLTARISTDDGRTWGAGLLLDERQDVSYPDGFQAPDGRIFIVYDHDRGGSAEILLATFEERDISAGHIVSPTARLSQQIDSLHPPSQLGTRPQ